MQNELIITPSIHDLFSDNFKNHYMNLFENTPGLIDYPLLESSLKLTLPLRSKSDSPLNDKIKFSAKSILNTNSGTPNGLISILNHL